MNMSLLFSGLIVFSAIYFYYFWIRKVASKKLTNYIEKELVKINYGTYEISNNLNKTEQMDIYKNCKILELTCQIGFSNINQDAPE